MAGRPRIRKLGSPTRHAVETWAEERPDLAPRDYLFLVHVMRLGQVIGMLHERDARQRFGLSGADVQLLIILRRSLHRHPPTAAELSEARMVTTGAMAKQLERLEALGLITRHASSGRGGGQTVSVTEQGLATADQAMTALVRDSALSRLREGLPPEDRETLASLCQQLLIAFEEQPPA